MKYLHRVSFRCDLFLDIETDSPDTTTEELDSFTQCLLSEMSGQDMACISDAGFDVFGLPGGRVYPRPDHRAADCQGELLEHFTSENCTEVEA